MSLATQVISGSLSALNLIKNYLANPSIAPSVGGMPIQLITKQVPLQCESYKENLDAEVSTQLIVNTDLTGGVQYISDNIAPKPRTWELKGWIAASPLETIASPILMISQSLKLSYLREMYASRQMIAFRTKNGTETVLVGMKNLQIDSDPLIQNRIPFTMSLQEMPVMTFTNNSLAIPSGSSNPSADAIMIGTAAAQTLAIGTSIAATSATNTAEANNQITGDAIIASMPKPSGKSVKAVYVLPVPTVADGTFAFSFNAQINGAIFPITAKFINSQWSIFMTLPDGSIRNAAVLPNITQWTGYPDYGFFVATNLDSIGQNDLSKVTIYLVEWA